MITRLHKEKIILGDTILQNGELKTISNTSFSYSKFMGLTINGDSYKLGQELVSRVDNVAEYLRERGLS